MTADPRMADDRALIQQAQGGDKAAWESLVRNHLELCFRTACLITRSPKDAETVVEEGFLRAYRGLYKFDAAQPFRPWILKIVAAEAHTFRRSESLRPGRLWSMDATTGSIGDDQAPIGSSGEAAQKHAVLAALDRLDEPDRLAICYRYLFGLPDAEVAEALDVPAAQLPGRLTSAMSRLRLRMGPAA